jgi:hypothetical protein
MRTPSRYFTSEVDHLLSFGLKLAFVEGERNQLLSFVDVFSGIKCVIICAESDSQNGNLG